MHNFVMVMCQVITCTQRSTTAMGTVALQVNRRQTRVEYLPHNCKHAFSGQDHMRCLFACIGGGLNGSLLHHQYTQESTPWKKETSLSCTKILCLRLTGPGAVSALFFLPTLFFKSLVVLRSQAVYSYNKEK
jgi:hypothetical protein